VQKIRHDGDVIIEQKTYRHHDAFDNYIGNGVLEDVGKGLCEVIKCFIGGRIGAFIFPSSGKESIDLPHSQRGRGGRVTNGQTLLT
jgi:hypothetical protein